MLNPVQGRFTLNNDQLMNYGEDIINLQAHHVQYYCTCTGIRPLLAKYARQGPFLAYTLMIVIIYMSF